MCFAFILPGQLPCLYNIRNAADYNHAQERKINETDEEDR